MPSVPFLTVCNTNIAWDCCNVESSAFALATDAVQAAFTQQVNSASHTAHEASQSLSLSCCICSYVEVPAPRVPGFVPINVHHSSSTRPSVISFSTHSSGTTSKDISSKGEKRHYVCTTCPMHCHVLPTYTFALPARPTVNMCQAQIAALACKFLVKHDQGTKQYCCAHPVLTPHAFSGESKAKSRTFVSTPASISLAVKNNQGVQAGQGCMQPGAWRGCKKSAW